MDPNGRGDMPSSLGAVIAAGGPRLAAAIAAAEAWMASHGLDGYPAWSLAGDVLAAADRAGAVPDDLDNGPGRALVQRVTPVVHDADVQHQAEGGGTRHWVRDCFLPHMQAAGLTITEVPDAH